MNRSTIHSTIHTVLCTALAGSLPLNQLKWSSFLVMLLLVNWLVSANFKNKWEKLHDHMLLFMTLSALFFILALRCLWEPIPLEAFKVVERKSVFFLLPLFLLSSPKPSIQQRNFFVYGFSFCLALFSIFVLTDAGVRAVTSGQWDSFFYHELAIRFELHAVYYAMLCLVNLVLLESLKDTLYKRIYQTFLFGLILLLSSKLFIGLSLLYALFKLFQNKQLTLKVRKRILGIILLLLLGLGITENPISNRFRDLSPERLHFISQDYIGEDVYLDGVSLRLLQVRFAGEIVGKNKNWICGVGPKSAQDKLNEKYREVHLYAADGQENTGYIGLNFHNQYAESLVQGGVFALLAICVSFFLFLNKSMHDGNQQALLLTLIFVLFCLSESVFERQLGNFGFLLFILWSIESYHPSIESKFGAT